MIVRERSLVASQGRGGSIYGNKWKWQSQFSVSGRDSSNSVLQNCFHYASRMWKNKDAVTGYR